jgi:hypothetical protein
MDETCPCFDPENIYIYARYGAGAGVSATYEVVKERSATRSSPG